MFRDGSRVSAGLPACEAFWSVRLGIGISWDWAEAGRGVLCTLPGAAILLGVDVSLGMIFALGTLPVAMLGVPASRDRRPRLGLIGLAFAIAYSLGSILGLDEAVAIAGLTVLAYVGVVVGFRNAAARLLPALVLPAIALGMNHPAPSGFAAAGVMLAGSVWATLVTWAWPVGHASAVSNSRPAPPPDPARARRAARIYALLFAAAAGIGLALGYVLEFGHIAWTAAAAMFIMRPDASLLASRALGRTAATFAGVIAAGLIIRHGPTEIAIAIITVGAVSAMIAVHTSRWYVSSAGSGLVVLLVSGVAGADAFAVGFRDRLVETALGAGLALTFGLIVPYTIGRTRRRASASFDREPEAEPR